MSISRLFTALRAIIWGAGFVLLWSYLASAVRPFDARLGIPIPMPLRALGWVVAAGGAALAASCIVAFVTVGEGTPAPFDPPRNFVAVGPYRWVRNPMYVGALSVILGIGLVARSASIVLLSIVFFLCAHIFVVLYEEPTLSGMFGASYAQYRSSVRRWLVRRPR